MDLALNQLRKSNLRNFDRHESILRVPELNHDKRGHKREGASGKLAEEFRRLVVISRLPKNLSSFS